MNTPYQEAKDIYAKKELDLNQVILHHAAFGYVFISPDYVLIGMDMGDYWFIECAVGVNCLTKFLELMPYYKPYVAWARPLKGRTTKRYSIEQLKRILTYGRPKTSFSS